VYFRGWRPCPPHIRTLNAERLQIFLQVGPTVSATADRNLRSPAAMRCRGAGKARALWRLKSRPLRVNGTKTNGSFQVFDCNVVLTKEGSYPPTDG
jgi:hypothetical protein